MIKGIPASPGIGVGTAFIIKRTETPSREQFTTSPSEPKLEMERFIQGRKIVETYYLSLVEKVKIQVSSEEAEIFESYIELLTGDDIQEGVETKINEGSAVELAVLDFTEETAKEFDALESEYFRARGEDIRHIGRNLVEAIYHGSITESTVLQPESIIVAEDLSPSETVGFNIKNVRALVTEKGGRTSHTAILARSLSIPCITGIEGLLDKVKHGQLLLVDGDRGIIETDVDKKKLKLARSTMDRQKEETKLRKEWSVRTPDLFSDGSKYHLLSNAGGIPDAQEGASYGAKGIGLLRTEFLFMRYPDFPSLAQQANEYREVCQSMTPHPVTIRLLDCGADKPLPYQALNEDNPLLGERGIRFLLNKKEQLKRQVDAIVQIAEEGHAIKIMIPMIISASEVEEVRSFIPPEIKNLELGIMVETPAAVLLIASLAKVVDFVSIGTNDLVQYVLAVDRGNAKLAGYYQEFHPAVLAAINAVTQGCKKEKVQVSVCGNMATRPETALALHALGVDALSAAAASLPILKACFAKVSKEQLSSLREKLLTAPTAKLAEEAAKALVPADLSPWR